MPPASSEQAVWKVADFGAFKTRRSRAAKRSGASRANGPRAAARPAAIRRRQREAAHADRARAKPKFRCGSSLSSRGAEVPLAFALRPRAKGQSLSPAAASPRARQAPSHKRRRR